MQRLPLSVSVLLEHAQMVGMTRGRSLVTGVLLERRREQCIELLKGILDLCGELALPDRARCAK
jgi:hypothetical protein